jgi:hypothetical protein
MKNVQRFRELGLGIPSAVKAGLDASGLSVAAFALKHQLRRQHVSRAINGQEAPVDRLVDALVAELGGAHDEWRALLHEAGRPTPLAAVAGR